MKLDDLSPPFYGEDRITVQVEVGQTFLAGAPVLLRVSYEDCDPGGPVLPVVVEVQPAFGDGDGYVKRVFPRTPPTAFAFVPQVAGDYLVLVRESAHNRWQGRLIVRVGGDEVDDQSLGG